MITRSETILIVEDDAQIRNFISYVLQQEGFPHLSAGTAKNALSLLVTNPVDLVLLDLGLPDCDGMDVIKKSENGRKYRLSSCRRGIRIMKKRRR